MIESTPLVYFDKDKPFYPLVLNYLASLHGISELLMRGLIVKLKVAPGEVVKKEIKEFPKYATLLNSLPTQFPEPLALKSEFQGNSIKIDADEIASVLVTDPSHIRTFTNHTLGLAIMASASVLILAYETTAQYHDNGPLWEFLRHCRNAAAHNGLFYFKKGEPRRLAKWGKFTIEVAIQGTPLFANKNTHGLFGPGDPICLLWDIEKAYPNMRV
ncbi:MAG: hypothetical protein HW384_1222 [Dehalococcoidia bacterium]|nr:hypothetical protein [Dehalococcoidia bacterium]